MKNEIKSINISKLKPYRNHMFEVYNDAKYERLYESIHDNGVLVPIICRPVDLKGNFEILAGHNRVHVCNELNITEIPAIICSPSSEEEADLIAIETNMCQRDMMSIPISQRAKVISRWYNIVKRQGRRTDLLDEIQKLESIAEYDTEFENSEINSLKKVPSNADEIRENSTSRPINNLSVNDYLTDKTGISQRMIQRLLRIAMLPDGLLAKIDDETLSVHAGVDLSYIKTDTLMVLDAVLATNTGLKVTMENAMQLRKTAKKNGGYINDANTIVEILKGEKKVTKPVSVTLKAKTLDKYFAEKTPKKIIATKVDRSLELTQHTIPQILAEYQIDIPEEQVDEYVKNAVIEYVKKDGVL